MLSIGWVIFWKSVVLLVFAALAERWRSLRASRSLELRQRRDGVYVVHDPLQTIETWAVRLFKTGAVLLFIYGLIVFWMLTGS